MFTHKSRRSKKPAAFIMIKITKTTMKTPNPESSLRFT